MFTVSVLGSLLILLTCWTNLTDGAPYDFAGDIYPRTFSECDDAVSRARFVRLSCSGNNIIHISQVEMGFMNDCGSDDAPRCTSNPRSLDEAVRECEGRRSFCKLQIANVSDCTEFNSLSITFECVPDVSVHSICPEPEDNGIIKYLFNVSIFLATPNFVLPNRNPGYRPNAECSCEITPSGRTRVNPHSLYVDIEHESSCVYGVLSLNSQDYCGIVRGTLNASEFPNSLSIEFKSDGSVEGRGAWLKLSSDAGFNLSCYGVDGSTSITPTWSTPDTRTSSTGSIAFSPSALTAPTRRTIYTNGYSMPTSPDSRGSMSTTATIPSKTDSMGEYVCADGTTRSCAHKCVSTRESFYCTCDEGFTVGDFYDCIDVDECKGVSHGICEQNCVNTIGSFFCTCEEGFVVEGFYFCTEQMNQRLGVKQPQTEIIVGAVVGLAVLLLVVAIVIACVISRRRRAAARPNEGHNNEYPLTYRVDNPDERMKAREEGYYNSAGPFIDQQVSSPVNQTPTFPAANTGDEDTHVYAVLDDSEYCDPNGEWGVTQNVATNNNGYTIGTQANNDTYAIGTQANNDAYAIDTQASNDAYITLIPDEPAASAVYELPSAGEPENTHVYEDLQGE